MIENSVLEDAPKKKGIKLSPALASEAISGANNEWFVFTQLIMPALAESGEAWQLYLENQPADSAFASPEDSATAANVRAPAIAQAIDSVQAQQHLTNFPDQESFFEAEPQNEMGKTNKKMIEAYMAQEMRNLNFLIKVFLDRKNLLLDGTSAVAVPFKRKVRKKAVYAWPKIFGFEIPIGKPRKEMVDTVVSEGTDFKPLRFEDWRIDPTVDDWERTPFLYKYYLDVDAIKGIDGYRNTDQVTTYSQAWDESDFLRNQKLLYNNVQADLAIGEDKDGLGEHKALVMERWGDFHLGGKVYKDHVLVWANESILLFFGPNPYDHGDKPFIISQYNPIPNSLLGKSCIKDAIPTAHALDHLRNMVLDILNNCAHPYATYLDSDPTLEAYMDNEDTPLAPGSRIPVKSHDSLKERAFALPNLTWIGQMEMNLKEDLRECTGGVPYAGGGMSQAQNDRTLGEVEILANGTSTKFMALVGFYENAKLHPYLTMFYENAKQFMSAPVYIADFEQMLSPATLKLSEMLFEVTGSRAVMESQKLQSARLNFMQSILPLMLQNGYAITNGDVLEVNVAELAKDAAVDAKVPNVDDRLKVVSSTTEISQQADNPMAAQQASQGMTMGSGMDGSQPIQQPQ